MLYFIHESKLCRKIYISTYLSQNFTVKYGVRKFYFNFSQMNVKEILHKKCEFPAKKGLAFFTEMILVHFKNIYAPF